VGRRRHGRTGATAPAALAYIRAAPPNEPLLPGWVALWAHHLHCVMHSALVAGLVSACVWRWRPAWLLALAGWWVHIGIDVFTHSRDYYPVPLLYPLTRAGFDGIAWNTPWFMGLNYGALVLVYAVLVLTRWRGGRA
jgi:hypothetical protein